MKMGISRRGLLKSLFGMGVLVSTPSTWMDEYAEDMHSGDDSLETLAVYIRHKKGSPIHKVRIEDVADDDRWFEGTCKVVNEGTVWYEMVWGR